jgi:hypothetical protein
MKTIKQLLAKQLIKSTKIESTKEKKQAFLIKFEHLF